MKIGTKQKKIMTIIIVLCLVGGGIYYWQKQSVPSTKATYTVGTVEKGHIGTYVSATGTINPVNSVDVSTKISGLLKEVLVKENQHVEKGDVLAIIEDKSVTASVEDTKNKMENAWTHYERYQALYDQAAIAKETLDDARLAYLTAKTNYEKAQGDYEDTIITSPITGTVIGEPLKAGQTVSQGLSSQMIIVTVADEKELEIRLLVDETDIGSVKEGQKVQFTVDAYPDKTYTGRVSSISKGTKGSVDTTSTTVVYYTVKVAVDTNDMDGLLPMMTARATIIGDEVDQALLVPLTAIRTDAKGSFVYVIENGKPTARYITTGITGDTEVEVKKGLHEGDQIVVSGVVDGEKQAPKANGPIRV